MDFSGILKIIKGTPFWVYVIFGYLLFLGLRATRTRTISLLSRAIIPLIFLFWSLAKLFMNNAVSFELELRFLLPVLLGGFVGFFVLAEEVIDIQARTYSMTIRGSWMNLFLYMSIFVVKYVFGYLRATNPIRAAEYADIEIVVFAIITGIMLGRLFGTLLEYRRRAAKKTV